MVDLFFVGKLGHIEVAALAIAGTVVAVLMMLVQGIAVGTMVFISHFTGEKNYDMADNILGQTFILSVIGAVIMLPVSFFLVEPLLRIFGASGDVLAYAADYLRINFIFSIFIFLFVGTNHALRGSGDARTPLYALVIANILNIILDPMFIMGYGPFPCHGSSRLGSCNCLTRGYRWLSHFLL